MVEVIRVLTALSVVVVAGWAHPEKGSAMGTIRVGAVPFPVVGRESDAPPQTGEAKNVAYSRCDENHEACAKHCRSVEGGYSGGRCVGDVCLCRYPEPERKPSCRDESCASRCRRKSGRCYDGKCVCTPRAEVKCDEFAGGDACSSVCRRFRKMEGLCVDGLCKCEDLSRESDDER